MRTSYGYIFYDDGEGLAVELEPNDPYGLCAFFTEKDLVKMLEELRKKNNE